MHESKTAAQARFKQCVTAQHRIRFEAKPFPIKDGLIENSKSGAVSVNLEIATSKIRTAEADQLDLLILQRQVDDARC